MQFIVVVVVLCLVLMSVIRNHVANISRLKQHIHMFDFPFETGDLFLSSEAVIVSLLTKSRYGHVGIIYKDSVTHQVYIWHLNIGTRFTHTILCGHRVLCLKMEPLYKYLEAGTRCRVVRQLRGNKSLMTQLTNEWIHKQIRQYRFDASVLARAARRTAHILSTDIVHVPISKTLTSCVELATRTYVHMGVFKTKALQQGILSEDYSQLLDHRLPFRSDFSFGPEIELKY